MEKNSNLFITLTHSTTEPWMNNWRFEYAKKKIIMTTNFIEEENEKENVTTSMEISWLKFRLLFSPMNLFSNCDRTPSKYEDIMRVKKRISDDVN